MSLQKIYTLVRTVVVVGGISSGAGIFWGMLVAGLARFIFDLEEYTALLWIGMPVFLVFTTWGVFYMPSVLRKAGFLE